MAQQAQNLPPESEMPQMGILDHLNEMRVYVVRAAIGLLVGVIVAFLFTETIFTFLLSCNFPAILIDTASMEQVCAEIITTRPTENIENFLRLAFFAGIALSMPWIVYQLWRFISPGLHKHEKRYVYIFVPALTFLFLFGAVFAWAVLMPPAFFFLSSFQAENVEIKWTIDSYISFVTGFLLWLGLAFEMPLIFYFLSRFGFVSSKMLRENWRFAVVGIAILAAMITPSIDPVTMVLTMIPLTVLYLASIGLSALGYRQFMK